MGESTSNEGSATTDGNALPNRGRAHSPIPQMTSRRPPIEGARLKADCNLMRPRPADPAKPSSGVRPPGAGALSNGR